MGICIDTTKGILKNSPLMPVIIVSGFMFGGSPDFEAMAIEALNGRLGGALRGGSTTGVDGGGG
jgi:hypothetical protein